MKETRDVGFMDDVRERENLHVGNLYERSRDLRSILVSQARVGWESDQTGKEWKSEKLKKIEQVKVKKISARGT